MSFLVPALGEIILEGAFQTAFLQSNRTEQGQSVDRGRFIDRSVQLAQLQLSALFTVE